MLNFVVLFLFSVTAVSGCGVGEYYNGGVCKNCDAGTFMDLTNHQTTSCKECPVGYFSVLQASECDNCVSGQYSGTVGASACIDCALGKYQEEDSQSSCKSCPQGFSQISTTSCAICLSGKYQNSDFICEECPAGYSQPIAGSLECNECTPGTYAGFASDGQRSCNNCPQGYFQEDPGQTSCKICTGQMYSPIRASKCFACGLLSPCCVGWAPNNEGICQACSPGNYQDVTNPGDSVYTDGTSCQKCPEGTVSAQLETITGYDSCEECPAGAYASLDTCLPCPTGFYGANGFCLDCIEGKHAPSIGSQFCQDCPAGRFTSVNNTQICTACPAGESTNNIAGSTECIGCAAGLRSAIGAAECTATCPTGGQDASAVCNTCTVGNEWNGAACVACATGKFKFDTPSCIDCPSTQVSNAARDGCEDCPAPQQALAGVCTDCPAGYKYATDQCETCIGGKYQDQAGLTSCKDCNEGKYQNQLSQTSCTDCPRGFFNVGLSNLECETCPEGWVSGLTSNSCTACPSDQGPSATLDFCASCPAGKEVSLLSPFVCNDCPVGKSNNVAGTVCDWCTVNTYQDQKGQTTCKTCTGAGFQTNIDGIGSSSCDQTDNPRCAKGEYFATIISECANCPVGKFGLGGQATECSDCPAGFVSIEASSDCTLCTNGEGVIDGICRDCFPGKYEINGVCTDCPAGFNQYDYAQTQCNQCPQFEESPPNSALCTPCTVNQHTIIENGRCSTCQSGKVYLGGTNLVTDCTVCSPGSEPSGTSACTPCRVHYFNINPGTYCEACPLGWSQKDTGQTFCAQCGDSCNGICPEGSVSIGSACFPCSPGTTSLGGRETVCSNCGIGKSQPLSGQKSCDSCEPGKYASEPRQSQCKLCTSGQYMAESGQGACRDCIQGTYTNQGGQTQCLICGMGKFAEDNDAGRQGDCKECPVGWFGLPTGLCDPCPESTYQDQTGQATCKSCTVDSGGNALQKPLSAPSSTDVSDCFDGDGLITYVFGMKDDAKEVQVETSECEIRPNMVLLCPSCSCNDNSRDGFWAGPTCNECRHGFAGGRTGKCLLKCPGYDGIHDSTMCSGNGKCWYGKYGSGQCLCGGKSILDASSDNIVVDVKTCPAGQKCNGYGDEILLETEYIPFYYLLEYRQYSVFVLQLNTYTPFRGHMWFGRFSPQTIYENVCSTCVTPYDSTEYTQIGYFNENTYGLFPPESQVLNGFHGENCQHECATCVNYGKCLNTPHPYYYSYTLNSHESEVFTEVFVPQTQCICTSDIYDPDAMCCPHGFEPFVYYGKRQVTPYYHYTALPLITDLQNKRLDYWTNKDLWLQNIYPNYSQLNDSTQILVSNINNIYAGDKGTIGIEYASNGPYTKHTFYGTEKELCRACPGLFGKGVVSRSTHITTEQEAEDFWWDTSAKGEKCNGLGVCDFYRQDDEKNVLFMGEFRESNDIMFQESKKFSDCTAATSVLTPEVASIDECAVQSRFKYDSAKYVIYSESYKIDVYADGVVFDVLNEWDVTNGPENSIASVKNDATAVGYVTNVDNAGVTHYYGFAMTVPGSLPNPDANGEYTFHPKTEGECRYPTDSLPCVFLANSAYTVYELDVTGQGDDRLDDATHDRFDTCFTYTDVGEAKYRIGNYVTETYANGQDPFLGDDCPRGHFCTENSFQDNVVGFKEACPPGYYQPSEGIARTNSLVRCSNEYSATNEVLAACDPNAATIDPTDFVDKVCVRCPRHTYSAAGSYECTECPQGTIKKLSGAADVNTIVLNVPPPQDVSPVPWWYIPDETGDEQTDCAQIAPGFIHLPELNVHMDYSMPQFMSILSCPYGYSSDPGTYIISGHEDVIAAAYKSKISGTSAILPPFVLYEEDSTLPYDILQKNLANDYCFPCPSSSVSSAGLMQCTTCFSNSVKMYLKNALDKVLQNSMVSLDSYVLPSGADKPEFYGWDHFENMQMDEVAGNPALNPVNSNLWVSSGRYAGTSVSWRNDYTTVSGRGSVCNTNFFNQLGGTTTSISGEDFNTELAQSCRTDCEGDGNCNFLAVFPETVYSSATYHKLVAAKRSCGKPSAYGGNNINLGSASSLQQCANKCKNRAGCKFFNYDDSGYPSSMLIDSYDKKHLYAECSSDDGWLGEFNTEFDCFTACQRKAGCLAFVYGNHGGTKAGRCYDEFVTNTPGNVDCRYPHSLEEDTYDFYVMIRAPTNTQFDCYMVDTDSSDCRSPGMTTYGPGEASFYELVPWVSMPKGSCCKYSSFTTGNTWSYKSDYLAGFPNNIRWGAYGRGFNKNIEFFQVSTQDTSITLTQADAILLCNYLYPDKLGWDFMGYSREAKTLADGFTIVRCAQHKPVYFTQNSGLCNVDTAARTESPVTSKAECMTGATIIDGVAPNSMQDIYQGGLPYGCYRIGTRSYVFNSYENDNPCTNSQLCICKYRNTIPPFTHWDTSDYYSFERTEKVGSWAESSYPFCTSCGPGEKRKLDGTCEGCPLGRYTSTVSEASQQTCKACEAGQYSKNKRGTYCVKCEVGKSLSTPNGIGCIDCNPGQFASNLGSTSCQTCDKGRVSPTAGLAGCIDCGTGQFQANTGQTSCSSCLQGQFQNEFGKEACISCEPGLFQPLTAQGLCKQCPSGYFQGANGQTACTACAVGFAISSSGSTGPTCDACDVGKFAENEGSGSCTSCLPGHSCSASGQTACGPGTFADGVLGRETCETCPPGKASENTANSVCISCPNGKAINAAQNECIDCRGYNFNQIFPSPLVSGNSGMNSGSISVPASSIDTVVGTPNTQRNSAVGVPNSDAFFPNRVTSFKSVEITMIETTSLCFKTSSCINQCSVEYAVAGTWNLLNEWDRFTAGTSCTPIFSKGQVLQLRLQFFGDNLNDPDLEMQIEAENNFDFLIDLDQSIECRNMVLT